MIHKVTSRPNGIITIESNSKKQSFLGYDIRTALKIFSKDKTGGYMVSAPTTND